MISIARRGSVHPLMKSSTSTRSRTRTKTRPARFATRDPIFARPHDLLFRGGGETVWRRRGLIIVDYKATSRRKRCRSTASGRMATTAEESTMALPKNRSRSRRSATLCIATAMRRARVRMAALSHINDPVRWQHGLVEQTIVNMKNV